MIEAHDRVVVGVSGGADSVCLLFVLLALQQEMDFQLAVVHVEHGIRGGESLRDAEFVRKLCRDQGVSYYQYDYDIPAIAARERLSVEETARNCRYQAFGEVADQLGGAKIAVAHNREDQAETILHNLIRGSGMAGLCGMRPVSGRIVRPLLACSRQDIERWLQGKGVVWRNDRTNQETKYTRNKLRLKIIPELSELNGRAVEHIAAAGVHLQKAQDYLVRESGTRAARIGEEREGRAWLKRTELLLEDEVMQEYILRTWLVWIGVGLKDISTQHLEKIKALADGKSGRQIDLPGDCVAKCTGEFLVLGKRLAAVLSPDAVPLVVPGETRFGKWRIHTEIVPYSNQNIIENKYTKWLDYDTISDTACLRVRRPGDYIGLSTGHKKLKKYFIDEKVLQEDKDNIPLIAVGSHILWVVGYRISEDAKVTASTKNILKIQMTEEYYGAPN